MAVLDTTPGVRIEKVLIERNPDTGYTKMTLTGTAQQGFTSYPISAFVQGSDSSTVTNEGSLNDVISDLNDQFAALFPEE